jgi:hypothetical protein
MKIISAVYDTPERGYKKMAENMRKSAEAHGYVVVLHDLKDDPMDSVNSAHDYRVNCFFKPHVILEALNALQEDVIWLDGDCLVRERFDEILNYCDVAVTLRRFVPNTIRDIYDGYVNAGVMAFRNNLATKRFIEKWIAELPNGRADQDALNRVLLNYTDMNQYGEIVAVDGCRVKFVDCDKYNFFYFPEDSSGAKILHVKGSLRPDFYELCVGATCFVN